MQHATWATPRRWLIVDLCLALAVFFYLELSRHYPWPLALLSGLAVAALFYSLRRTVQNLRRLARPATWLEGDEPVDE